MVLFVLVTALGFFASRWRRADLSQLHEWGLGGHRFGTVITWFLLGGDLYTAYTFIAVPALVFGAGAMGFFALPYTVIAYPLVFMVLPRLWRVAHKHNFITGADFVRGRYGSPTLALLVALTGILATMPYIALQLVGMEVVIAALGFPMGGLLGDLPLIVAFVVLAAYTYTSGLRAPAMIALVKDALVYLTVITLVIVVPWRLGGFAPIFAAVPPAKLLLATPPAHSLGSYSAFASLALGSALALFCYPHVMTGVLASRNPRTLTRNMALLPAFSLALGLLALLGYMALASGVDTLPEFAPYFARFKASFAVPALILHSLPGWFAGVALAAIAIGALVPAAIMSIAAANLFTRNIYKAYINPKCSTAQETSVAKLVSLLVKFGALLFIIFDVEIAFFFPWATVFGKATHLMDSRLETIDRQTGQLTPAAANVYAELGVPHATPETVGATGAQIADSARALAWVSILDILVFFGVLMVGFAYVWRRGDLDWVRAVSRQRAVVRPPSRDVIEEEEEPALVG
ncbi:MAG: sodium:solute symporter [Planctomycetia bacterium 21-64-5]|nr:MAG: sodium:solute symporter [Planctomycetia bacterium 21-64-5]